jgi:hypothetical protein
MTALGLFFAGACREPKFGKRQHQLRCARADSQSLERLSISPATAPMFNNRGEIGVTIQTML